MRGDIESERQIMMVMMVLIGLAVAYVIFRIVDASVTADILMKIIGD